MPPIAKTAPACSARGGSAASASGPSGGPKSRLEGVSKIGPRKTTSAPSSSASRASAGECVDTPIPNFRGAAARTRGIGSPEAGK